MGVFCAYGSQVAALAKSSKCKSMGIVLPDGCSNEAAAALAQVMKPALALRPTKITPMYACSSSIVVCTLCDLANMTRKFLM